MPQHEHDWLAERFEENRPHLQAVAYRMLGGLGEADDAVQESWLRLSRSDTSGVENLSGWLTTVVARVCLDMLRSRKRRPEQALDIDLPEPSAGHDAQGNPEQELLLADSVGLALLVVFEALSPAERVAFVLHDMFGVPFDEIAPIVGRSSAAARQLASRARRRVQGTAPDRDADLAPQRVIVSAFLVASREGDFEALLAALDPDVVLRTDDAAAAAGASGARGARAVAEVFVGRARVAQLALLDGAVGAVWAPGGAPRVAFGFTLVGGRVVAIELVMDPERLEALDIAILDE